MENDALVSIIIPVYNTALYISGTLESVLRQTYQSLEIIIIDDGSADGSEKICDEYADRDHRIHVIHTQNMGLSAARNTGMHYAKGKFISFIDSDDWIEPQTVETLLETALRIKADVVAARTVIEYRDQSVHIPNRENYIKVYRGKDILAAYTEGKTSDFIWNKLYSASCWTLLKFPDGHFYEDKATTWK